MREHTHSVTRLFMPLAALAMAVGLGACVHDEPSTVTRTTTTRTTTTPGYATPGYTAPAPVTSGTSSTQTTIDKSDD